MTKWGLVAGISLLTGCATYDTGQIDYRVADGPMRATQGQVDAYIREACAANSNKPECTPPVRECQQRAVAAGAPTDHCDPLTPGTLIRRYQPASPGNSDNIRPFRANDVYSMELTQFMMGPEISEDIFSADASAEIVILANVFEFAAAGDNAAQTRFLETTDFPTSGNPRAGTAGDISSQLKVIYYSPNVEARQPLNFSNIPVMARGIYNGRAIGIQIVVVELDTMSGSVDSLLNTLSDLGQQSNIGPVAPGIQNILLGLGTSLLRGQAQDDIIFEYRFVLTPEVSEEASRNYAMFEPGRYVLRRSQRRDQQMDWRNLVLDHNTGRLYRRTFAQTPSGSQYEEFRDDTYMVLNIRRYPAGTAVENYQFQRMAELREHIQEAADINSPALNFAAEELSRRVRDTRSTNWLATLNTRWQAAELALRDYSNLYMPDDFGGCAAPEREQKEQRLRTSGLAEWDARAALTSFLAEYQRATTEAVPAPAPAAPAAAPATAPGGGAAPAPAPPAPPATAPVPDFQLADRDRLVAILARFFVPMTDAVADTFAAHDDFEGKYIGAAERVTAFVNLALARARDRAPYPRCAPGPAPAPAPAEEEAEIPMPTTR